MQKKHVYTKRFSVTHAPAAVPGGVCRVNLAPRTAQGATCDHLNAKGVQALPQHKKVANELFIEH